MELTPFWAGAVAAHGEVSVDALAAAAGCRLAELEAAGLDGLRAGGLSKERAQRWLRAGLHTDYQAITRLDARFPNQLAVLDDAPPVLFVDGRCEALVDQAVAVVGTRSCTGYGRAVARHLGGALAVRRVTVVSGLARGIDAEAHRGALASGTTVAVLAHGLSHTAPSMHRRLRREIIAAGGAVVSHWPDGVPPRPWRFLARNRWIAGLSAVVVVVEAPLRSGALATARQAADLGREVRVVPNAIGVESAAGALRMLEEGATALVDVEGFADEVSPGTDHAGTGLEVALADGPDAALLARRLQRPLTEVLVQLAELELDGRVVRLQGQRYVLGR